MFLKKGKTVAAVTKQRKLRNPGVTSYEHCRFTTTTALSLHSMIIKTLKQATNVCQQRKQIVPMYAFRRALHTVRSVCMVEETTPVPTELTEVIGLMTEAACRLVSEINGTRYTKKDKEGARYFLNIISATWFKKRLNHVLHTNVTRKFSDSLQFMRTASAFSHVEFIDIVNSVKPWSTPIGEATDHGYAMIPIMLPDETLLVTENVVKDAIQKGEVLLLPKDNEQLHNSLSQLRAKMYEEKMMLLITPEIEKLALAHCVIPKPHGGSKNPNRWWRVKVPTEKYPFGFHLELPKQD